MLKKTLARKARHKRIRSIVKGTTLRPRLAVFRSNHFIYAQVIDDETGKTLVSFNDMKIVKGTKTERAREVGKQIGELCKKAKIAKVIYDRGGFAYHGRVKALADEARSAGLEF